jgi:hypothetical protein
LYVGGFFFAAGLAWIDQGKSFHSDTFGFEDGLNEERSSARGSDREPSRNTRAELLAPPRSTEPRDAKSDPADSDVYERDD